MFLKRSYPAVSQSFTSNSSLPSSVLYNVRTWSSPTVLTCPLLNYRLSNLLRILVFPTSPSPIIIILILFFFIFFLLQITLLTQHHQILHLGLSLHRPLFHLNESQWTYPHHFQGSLFSMLKAILVSSYLRSMLCTISFCRRQGTV
jgi:hypothetical protein